MTPDRFRELNAAYSKLKLAVIGDFCLDRYLEIDSTRKEISIETNLPVYNIARVRAQPGAAGTVLNNLVALGVGTIHVIGFCGDDGEGYELRRALKALPGVNADRFVTAQDRNTFTYCKPLVIESGKAPRELNRFDTKNWTPTPDALQETIARHVSEIAESADALILMDQVDAAETGVATRVVQNAALAAARKYPKLPILADSRRGLGEYPPLGFKMNANEFRHMLKLTADLPLDAIHAEAAKLAKQNGQPVFITLAERGIVGALPDGRTQHAPSLPVRGEIDVVGAGDSVTANLAAALAAGTSLKEALTLAMYGASLVVHQLGTTGTASLAQIQALMKSSS